MRHSAHILLIYNENVIPRTWDATFFPARKKVAKEARFRSLWIAAGNRIVRDCLMAAIGAHSSGGIVTLLRQKLLCERRIAAVIFFARA